MAIEDDLGPKAVGDVEEDAEDEGEADAELGVLQCVDPLEGQRLEDGDELVHCQADDDELRADGEGVTQGPHDVSLLESDNYRQADHLVKDGGIAGITKSVGNIDHGRGDSDEDAQVGRRQPQQIHVHHPLR